MLPFNRYLCVLFVMAFFSNIAYSQINHFDYKRYLFGTPPTLKVAIQTIDTSAGKITVNGYDSQSPSTPFTWCWGDGIITTGFFPQQHAYQNHSKNFVLKVITEYSIGNTDSVEVLVHFASPSIIPISLSPDITVTIPSTNVKLSSRQEGYGFSGTLSYFNDGFFYALPRTVLEYVASVASSIQNDFVNGNVFLINGKFQQVMLRDSAVGGAYAIWYSSPVAFGVGDAYLIEPIGYSSLFHEMGHNFTLNTPATYYYGGKIDGVANAIYSEVMAQIFQHATGYELINNYKMYGLSDDLMFNIRSDVISSIEWVRSSYNHYVSTGKKFTSWNNPNTPADETFDTFMTIAYKFMEQAENMGQGYKNPVKRMMGMLQGFSSNWEQRYSPLSNTAAADTFRATLMVAAVSFGFGKDLRNDFRNLNFPISDLVYNELNNSVTSIYEERNKALPAAFILKQNYPNPFNPTTVICYRLSVNVHVKLSIFDILGKEMATLVDEKEAAGDYAVQWNANSMPSGIYFCRLQTGSFTELKKLILLK